MHSKILLQMLMKCRGCTISDEMDTDKDFDIKRSKSITERFNNMYAYTVLIVVK